MSPAVWSKTNDVDKVVVDNLEKISKEIGYSMAQTSLAWIFSKPYITALDIKLDDEIIKRLEASYVPHIKTGAF